MDTSRIAEAYFKRLLNETNPNEAVGELASMWEVRTNSTGPWLGLSRPEHQATMTLIYVGEVGNGGHTQFFANRGGDIANRVRAALREIGLVELDSILGSSFAVFPDGQVPAERAEIGRLIGTWNDDRFAELDRLDRMAWRLDALPRLLVYLREHEDELLRPERGLGEHQALHA